MLGWGSLLSHGTLLFAASFASLSYEASSITGRPNQSSIIILFISGLCLVCLRNVITRLISFKVVQEPVLPLQDILPFSVQKDLKSPSSESWSSTRYLPPRLRRLLLFSVATAVSLRVGFLHLILDNMQCTISRVEGFVPLLLTVSKYWYMLRRREAKGHGSDSISQSTAIHGGANYVWPAAFLTIANTFQSWAMGDARSTYICPLSSNARMTIPLLQILGSFLDCCILVSIEGLVLTPAGDTSSNMVFNPAFLGSIFMLSSLISSIGGIIAIITNTVYWIELFDPGWSYASTVAWYSTIFTIAIIAALHIWARQGLLHLALYLLCICTYSNGLTLSWMDRDVLPPIAQILVAVYLAFFLLGTISYVRIYANSGAGPSQCPASRVPSYAYTVSVLLILFLGWSRTSQTAKVLDGHPIELLVKNASLQSSAWLAQASKSHTLVAGVEEYRRRYQRNPPPGFDAWYKYAISKESVVMDDYDTIIEDLKPFWSISPAQIRHLSRQVVSHPFNEVSELVLRNGSAALGPNFLPTHRWMLDGVLDLIKDFTQHLPDMDLAFNLNDEPRVAIPYHRLQELRDAGSGNHVSRSMSHGWSKDRAKTWLRPEDVEPTILFEDHSRTNSFAIGSIACPPSSYAQRAYAWDASAFCTSCATPHSHGVFLSNWTLSASPCHQPDLRNLHGFYLSPAAFKPSHELLPIFSQSKVEGYSDILYPSPWNYIDKVKYDANSSEGHPDPPFAEKENTLFWRGATSEGVSRRGSWKGMSRQRAVHLTNNLTIDSRSPTLPILLPHSSLPGKYAYQYLSSDPISALNLSLNISIVNGIARAWDNDGAAQDAEFGFAPPSDFQDHWRYRFLLDVDGAGYSGRFLAFLQSKSLPFRSGIFRAWWDGRLTAWKHFVPVDVRLHGLFSTLAYFQGTGA
ncbi:hypothetical protein N7G274_005913 [Stereocaulon virgatum]|uniref:Glycosyl transferase CAP10 domain-containing protein n=1 Tax=Stereocaulon virgatum TaxID=373712 RepID=A0ABR4A804_9LECA